MTLSTKACGSASAARVELVSQLTTIACEPSPSAATSPLTRLRAENLVTRPAGDRS